MYKNIINLLLCPQCKKELNLTSFSEIDDEIIYGDLRCTSGHHWAIKNGILDLNSEEQLQVNNWSSFISEDNYKDVSEKLNDRNPDNIKKGRNVSIDFLISNLKKNKAKIILDIASGRGSLLKRIVEEMDLVQIVSIDLSSNILQINREEFGHLFPHNKISFIASDACNLPFKNKSIDLCVSYVGFQNMEGITMSKAICESMRVSKTGLKDIAIAIKDDNPKIEDLNNILKSKSINYDVKNCTEMKMAKWHRTNNNFHVKSQKIFESIGEPNDLDLIPIQGEPFSFIIYQVSE